MQTPFVVAVLAALSGAATHAGTIGSPLVTREGPEQLVVTWSADHPVDVYVSERPGMDAAAMRLISDDDADGRHEYASALPERPYFVLRSQRGAVRGTAERVLPLEAGSNFRDVGGYRTTDGKHVRWGLIYRSGAMPQLTDRDYALLGRLGIRVFCDLRSVEERELAKMRMDALPDARYFATDYPGSDIFGGLLSQSAVAPANDPKSAQNTTQNMYRQWPTSLAPQYREIFRGLLAGEAPLAFNCSAGQDRTGVATALVLTALGVPRDTILEDYHLSTTHRRPQFERGTADYASLAATNIVARYYVESAQRGQSTQPAPLFDETGRARLLAAFDEIETRWGSVERYLADVLDVDANDRARLRALYLE